MTQPYALFLADILEDAGKPADVAEKAASELRRLYDLADKYKWQVIDTCARAEKAEAQRDALLEVVNKLEYSFDGYIKRYPEEAEVRAAIAKCEEKV